MKQSMKQKNLSNIAALVGSDTLYIEPYIRHLMYKHEMSLHWVNRGAEKGVMC